MENHKRSYTDVYESSSHDSSSDDDNIGPSIRTVTTSITVNNNNNNNTQTDIVTTAHQIKKAKPDLDDASFSSSASSSSSLSSIPIPLVPTTTSSSSSVNLSSSSSYSTSSALSNPSLTASSTITAQIPSTILSYSLTPEQETVYTANLPNAELYERSYMHKEEITHAVWTPNTDFLITASCDGIIKFWKKTLTGIEFAKAYRAHLSAILSLVITYDGLRLATVGEDQTIKYFDIQNFDMVDMTKLTVRPGPAAVWCYSGSASKPYLAISEQGTPMIHLYNADNAGNPPETIKLHTSPVLSMSYSVKYDIVVSTDAKGIIEYWSAGDEDASSVSNITLSSSNNNNRNNGKSYRPRSGILQFTSKLETDLYELAKLRTIPMTITIDNNSLYFVITATDKRIRLYQFTTGKLLYTLDESIPSYDHARQYEQQYLEIEENDYNRRKIVEEQYTQMYIKKCQEFITPVSQTAVGPVTTTTTATTGSSTSSSHVNDEQHHPAYRPPPSNAIFDETSTFLIYPTLLGIKIMNVYTKKLVGIIGRFEGSERFLHLSCYQGIPTMSSQMALARGQTSISTPMSSTNSSSKKNDPTIVCCSFRKQRFYLFSRREPEDDESVNNHNGKEILRDVQNEPPSAREIALATKLEKEKLKAKLGKQGIIHTTKGDITVQFFGDITPLAVENFTELSKRNYYQGTIFHRVIKGFMIQGGDPQGDGTGGTSIWNREFEDEIHTNLHKFDRTGVLAMANAGPNTNGSQFFITTAPAPWLDGKHTIFGRVMKGMDVVKLIENVKTKDDTPLESIKILNITIQ